MFYASYYASYYSSYYSDYYSEFFDATLADTAVKARLQKEDVERQRDQYEIVWDL